MRLTDEKIREHYIKRWQEEYGDTRAGYSATNEDDFTKWSSELAQAEHEATLKKVGDYLDRLWKHHHYEDYVEVCQRDIEALKQGRMPE